MDYIILPIGQKKVFLIGHPINCNSCVWPCQISTVAEDSQDSQESVDSVTDSQKRREILSRRPSYRYRSSTGPLSQPQGGRKKSQSGNMTVMLTQCCQIGILFLMQIGCHFGSDWAVNEIWWHIVDWVRDIDWDCLLSLAGRSWTTCRLTCLRSRRSRRRNRRTTRPPPSPPLPCPHHAPSIRRPAASTVRNPYLFNRQFYRSGGGSRRYFHQSPLHGKMLNWPKVSI